MTLIRALQRLAVVALWFALEFAAVALAVFVGSVNYSGLRSGFELAGMDTRPLSEDPTIGWAYEALGLGNATQADLYAVAVAVAMGVGTFILGHLLVKAMRLLRDLRDYERLNDSENVHRAKGALMVVGGFIALLLPGLIAVAYWDFILFQLRVLSGSLDVVSPKDIWNLHDTATLRDTARQTFGLKLIEVSPWGYLGVTALASLGLEFAIDQGRDAWAAAERSLAELFAANEPQPGQPDPATDAAQGSHDSDEQSRERSRNVNEPARADDVPTTTSAAGSGGQPERSANAPHPIVEPISIVEPIATAPASPPRIVGEPTEAARGDERDVVGGEPGHRVTLADALAQPDRYVVDVEGQRIWDRAHYAQLHGAPEPVTSPA